MDFWGRSNDGGEDVSYPIDLLNSSIKSEDFDFDVDGNDGSQNLSSLCLSADQKPIAVGPRVAVYSNGSDPYFSSSSGSLSTSGSATTTAGTSANSGATTTTMGVVPKLPPFPLLHNSMGGSVGGPKSSATGSNGFMGSVSMGPGSGSMGSMGSGSYPSMDSIYIVSPSTTTTRSACTTPSSSSPFGSATTTTSTIATTSATAPARPHGINEDPGTDGRRKRQRLDHLTADQKLLRRKAKNRLAAQSARDRKKAKLTDLEVTVNRLTIENAQLQGKLRQLESEYELVQSTRSLSATCAYCDHLHQEQGHDNNGNSGNGNRDNNLVSSSMADNWLELM